MELPKDERIEVVLDALGDPTRRRIVDALIEAPRSVGAIAALLPVSRPAVSKHLRVLEAAGLVTFRPQGTSRIYAFDADAAGLLAAHWSRVWDEALGRFVAAAEGGGSDG